MNVKNCNTVVPVLLQYNIYIYNGHDMYVLQFPVVGVRGGTVKSAAELTPGL